MTSKKCAREECGKTVYPTEELKCLDKVWHKMCFKCTSCGMALNMKNYKGYDKKPYCDAHYPKTVASVVVDTPEMLRLRENTKLQSQVKYHEEYEKMKGTKMEIADDPELKRHLQNTKAQSLVQYHGEQEKKQAQDSNRPKEELTNVPSSIPTEQRVVGSIADYDPLNGDHGTSAASKTAEKMASFASQRQQQALSAQKTSSTLKTGAAQPAASAQGPKAGAQTGFTVKALYDYTAADKDEVSFKENDIIVNCAKVDEGWMTGTVQRSLTWGMLPANYVEKVNQPTGLFKLH